MRVLCVDCDNPFGPWPGGQSAFTHDFVLSLTDSSEVTLATLGPVEPKMTDPVSYRSIVKSVGTSKRNLLAFSVNARQFVRHDTNHDVIVEQFTSPFGPLGLPKVTKKPVIGIACYSFWDEASKKYHLPFSVIARRRLTNYRWLVANHSSIADKLRGLAPRAEIIVIEQLLDSRPMTMSMVRKTTALFLGRPDWHQKGLDFLAKALEIIDIPGLIVEIAGFSSSDPTWQRVARGKEFRCEVRFLDYITGDSKTAAFQRAKVILAPSRYEGPGMIVLEAAHFGVPTVAFDLPCFSDRREAMVLSSEISARGFASAMERAWFDKDLYDDARKACIELVAMKQSDTQTAIFQEFVKRVARSK
jgi:glycosyltransferase involved in cell wall biosynthesis